MKNKTKLRRRILVAFSLVLFFSFVLTGLIFNVAIRLRITQEAHNLIEQNNASGIGTILIVLVAIMFVISVIASYFLSNSITRPIEKLGDFALDIGKGNFDTNEYEFVDVELENLNNILNKSAKQLQVYDSEQKTFFQNVSHELRTPLMSIRSYAEGIKYGLMEPKDAGEIILTEADKLADLVTDLLYIAKIDNISTAYTFTETDLVEILRDSANRQQIMAEKNNLRFEFDFSDDIVIYNCVAELISRAIDNLISNAIRYSKSIIKLSCIKNNDYIVISVFDDGDGIDADDLPHIFERFYKGKDGHTGIGLSIVKSIADQHKGKISAENPTTGGAVFYLILPTN